MVHDIGFAKSLRPIGYRMMLEEWPTTFYAISTGGVWSLFSGMGEWRNWVITNDEYRAMSDDVLDAKKSLARLEFSNALAAIGQILQKTPGFALAVFIVMGAYHLLLLIGTIFGLPRLLRHTSSPLGWMLLLWLLYLLATAGPSGNSRYVAPLLPLLCLPAASALLTLGWKRGTAPA
jgi:hypothetical protein